MAATVTSAWAKPGAWALDSEQHEDELNQPPPAPTPAPPTSDFPDLMTAAATKTKKKKAQTLSLGQFVSSSSNQTYQTPKGLTAEDLLNLPTGPRQRTAEELAGTRLGGGFRSYGDRNNESSNSRWGSGRGSGGGDEEGRRSSREPLGPSRADEIDDWGAMKKSTVGGGFDRRERGGGGGFGEGSHSRADNSDNWGRKKEPRFSGGSGSAFDSLRERRVANDSSDSDTWGKKREESSVGGGGGGGRPRLNLQPRKLPVGEVENVKPAKGSNPFGEARPREEVLKEKGEDWKEIDEKLEAMKMKELGSGDRFKRGGGKPRSVEDLSEKSWRKNQAVDADVAPPSGENNENGGHTEESEPKPEEDAQK
ncbi:putative plant specific eukaryotic initiation factor 4B [Helianthus annuus]|nr:putative plant specific eukaryotic initiation factor 4B [Helianthus annuus]KAJ0529845.1 putative plant specific eukaryotic initiation factor 4B [Helianthus annuus]KAJ0696720.1 putative plant specific eukaryotic initiation factor 4B [Helianthus annuus]